MTDKVVIVTPPDDVLLDGIRILLVDLQPEQSKIISDALTQINDATVIAYVWKIGEDLDWLLDKKHKSQLIFFNADSQNETLVGYLAAQRKSYYFGNLKSLQSVNNSAIYNTDQCCDILFSQIDEEK